MQDQIFEAGHDVSWLNFVCIFEVCVQICILSSRMETLHEYGDSFLFKLSCQTRFFKRATMFPGWTSCISLRYVFQFVFFLYFWKLLTSVYFNLENIYYWLDACSRLIVCYLSGDVLLRTGMISLSFILAAYDHTGDAKIALKLQYH